MNINFTKERNRRQIKKCNANWITGYEILIWSEENWQMIKRIVYMYFISTIFHAFELLLTLKGINEKLFQFSSIWI